MKQFLSVRDVDHVPSLVQEAIELKGDPFGHTSLGKNKTLNMVFLNPSLRTRLSTQKAAQSLGMNPLVFNVGGEGWAWELNEGVVMDGNTAEHIREAARVIGAYSDIVGIRTFAQFEDRDFDYRDSVIKEFARCAGVPVISLESATLHPCQSLADCITIEELKKVDRPKVVLTWAPHPKALPQAVANSFCQWMNEIDVDLVVTHPEGYELAPEFLGNGRVTHNQEEAFRGADFVYAKNWSSYEQYGRVLSRDKNWMVTAEKMALTNQGWFMHCLPVRRNVVVEDAVLDGDQSAVIKLAKNREYSAQVVLKKMLESI